MARRVLVGNQKGGVGKTTVVLAMATKLAEAGDRVLVVDIDPQRSATSVTEHMEQQGTAVPWDIATETDPAILRQLGQLTDYDTVVVDTAGSLENPEPLKAAVSAADYVVVPTLPAWLDLRATMTALTTIFQPAQVPYRVLLSRVDSRSPVQAVEAREALIAAGHPVFRTSMRMLKPHADAVLEGRLLSELPGASARNAEADAQRVVAEYLADLARGGTR